MDYWRDPLLVAVERALREATQRYEQRPTPEHARGAAAAHRLAAAAYEALAAAQPIPAAAQTRVAPRADRAADPASSPQPSGALLRIAEAAELLGVSRSTLYQLVSANAVPVVRVGRLVRIPRDALLRWIENQAYNPES
jgi:excisionase family DNA binding protein